MVQHVSIRLSDKDTYLKGFVKLAKSEGAILSRYCSFAMQYFIQNRAFAHLADIVPEEGEKGNVYVNLTMDETLLAQIDASAAMIKMSRGKMIKSILLNGIHKSDSNYLLPEANFVSQLLTSMKKDEVSVPVPASNMISKPIITEVPKSPNIDKAKSPQNALLNNFFPSVMEQAADWD